VASHVDRSVYFQYKLAMSLIGVSRPSKLASLTLEEFHKLYFEEKKSLAEIGSLYGVHRVTIYKAMKTPTAAHGM
jgi:hypothetical protein